MRTAKVPENFKFGLITPVFKGHGADPVKTDNYRDITVQTILCKVFEKILDKRLGKELERADVPSELQFAYRKKKTGNFTGKLHIAGNYFSQQRFGKNSICGFLGCKKMF